jgi:hypothetical protein
MEGLAALLYLDLGLRLASDLAVTAFGCWLLALGR